MPTGTSKTPCDLLVSARWLLPLARMPVSDSTPIDIIEQGAVAVAAGRIVAVGERAALLDEYAPLALVERPHHVLLPGLVNAHCHAAMTLLKGMGEGLSLMPWLEDVIWPAERRLVNPDFVSLGTDLALIEMLRRGVTTFADMYFFPGTTAERARRAGVRAQLSVPIIEIANAWSTDADDSIRKALALHDQWRDDPLLHMAFGPHSAYALGEPSLRKVQMYADELDLPVHIHLHENAEEVSGARAAQGSGWIEHLERLGMLTPRLQAVHLTQLDDRQIALLAERGVHAIHCPHSNLKLASGLCPTATLRASGTNVALGTDGALSNNTLDVLSEARLATLLSRLHQGSATTTSAHTALAMATLGGARALGLEQTLGGLAPGFAADMITFDCRTPALTPLADLAGQLLHAGGSLTASDVWVNGVALLADGALCTLDETEILARAERWQAIMAA